tara:strand:- start:30 stop:686 length:657 start_codon:yes stop_codon:yes gene_type:complete
MSTIKVDTVNEKSTNGNIAVIPTGSGKLVLDGLTWPHADGSAGQIIKSNGSAVLSFIDAPSAGFTLASPQATTSGTAFTFGSIPTGVSLILINFTGVSLAGTDKLLITIGDAGGLETSGYISTALSETGGTPTVVDSTAGFIMNDMRTAASIVSGTMTLALSNASTYSWIESHMAKGSTSASCTGGGQKSLSAELTQLQVTRTGSDAFDAGAVNIMYQ